MEKLLKAGRFAYALGLAGLGIQQFVYPGFRPVFVPLTLPDVWPLVYLFSLALLFVAGSILFNFRARTTCLFCGAGFLILFLVIHLPAQLANDPTSLGAWTNAFKILAFSGGAFIIAGTFPGAQNREQNNPSFIKLLEKLIPIGRFFFSIMFIIFGIDHFLYAGFVATLVPEWIGGNLFWTYFSAVALIGAGLALMLKFKQRLIGILTGTMLFIWFLILHIPRAVAMPDLMNGNEITSVFQALAFSGVAFVLATERLAKLENN
jgi:uncharacterized membrane protein